MNRILGASVVGVWFFLYCTAFCLAEIHENDQYVYQIGWNGAPVSKCRVTVVSMSPELRLNTNFDPISTRLASAENRFFFYYRGTKETSLNANGRGIHYFEVDGVRWIVSPTKIDLFDCEGIAVTQVKGNIEMGRFEIAERIDVFDLIGLLFSFCRRGGLTSPETCFLLESNLRKKIILKNDGMTRIETTDPASGQRIDLSCKKIKGLYQGDPVFDLYISEREALPVKLVFANGVEATLDYRENKNGRLRQIRVDLAEVAKEDMFSSLSRVSGDVAEKTLEACPEGNAIRVSCGVFEKGFKWGDSRLTVALMEAAKKKLSEFNGANASIDYYRISFEGDGNDVYFVLETNDGSQKSGPVYLKDIGKPVFDQLIGGNSPPGSRLQFRMLKCSADKPLVSFMGDTVIEFQFEISKNYTLSRLKELAAEKKHFNQQETEKKGNMTGTIWNVTVMGKRDMVR